MSDERCSASALFNVAVFHPIRRIPRSATSREREGGPRNAISERVAIPPQKPDANYSEKKFPLPAAAAAAAAAAAMRVFYKDPLLGTASRYFASKFANPTRRNVPSCRQCSSKHASRVLYTSYAAAGKFRIKLPEMKIQGHPRYGVVIFLSYTAPHVAPREWHNVEATGARGCAGYGKVEVEVEVEENEEEEEEGKAPFVEEDFDGRRRPSRPQYFVVPVSYGEAPKGIAFPPRRKTAICLRLTEEYRAVLTKITERNGKASLARGEAGYKERKDEALREGKNSRYLGSCGSPSTLAPELGSSGNSRVTFSPSWRRKSSRALDTTKSSPAGKGAEENVEEKGEDPTFESATSSSMLGLSDVRSRVQNNPFVMVNGYAKMRVNGDAKRDTR
ncbi:hypothetical protein EAI_11679 [Harpegnathos saltator]|uniref:Uncharacterized protein n=1 Tax=Harpegnathos saltator TaxID=610380 RepID=E2BYX9_HARSA|nr:hypothetical protein EAI_11679 [Harpegnathos saltator]